jgi:Flp pilus assembly protein protease CpaA
VIIISIRPVLRTTVQSRWVVLRPKGGIPYGIAIAIGTAVMTSLLR